VLNQCSNTLQGRSDAVSVTQLCDTFMAAGSSPGEAVLELIRRKEQRRVALGKKALEAHTKEEKLSKELANVKKKMEVQTKLLEAAGVSPTKERGGGDFFEM